MRLAIVENRLRDERVRWEYMEPVPLDQFDLEASRTQQGRKQIVLPDTIERYTLAMIAGDEFPAVVAYAGRRGYILLDGVQRLHAAKDAERAAFDLYRVDETDTYVLERLRRTLNVTNGVPLTMAELLEHGMYLVRTYNRFANEVAADLRIPVARLRNYMKIQERKARLATVTAKGTRWDRLTDTAIDDLGKIQSDRVLREATSLVSEARIATDDVIRLVKDVNEKRSEDEQLAAISEWRARPEIRERARVASRGHKPAPQTARMELLRWVRGLAHHLDRHPTIIDLQLTSPEMVMETRQEVDLLVKRLWRMFRGSDTPIYESLVAGALPDRNHPG